MNLSSQQLLCAHKLNMNSGLQNLMLYNSDLVFEVQVYPAFCNAVRELRWDHLCVWCMG